MGRHGFTCRLQAVAFVGPDGRVSAGHSLRRPVAGPLHYRTSDASHYELGTEAVHPLRLAAAFTDLAQSV